MLKSKSKFIGLLVLLAVFIVLPFFIGEYFADVLIIFFINIIIVTSFRLITTTGGWNLAHIALMGVGAYTSSILARSFGIPFYGTVPLAALTAALVGMGLSYPLRRTSGFAFFIASWAGGEAMRLVWSRVTVPFGGHRGILNIPAPDFTPIPGLQTINFGHYIPYYFLTLGITVVCVLIMYRIDVSRIGHTFKAIYSEIGLARSVGIDAARYKTLAFTIGSLFAGIAGALYAHHLHSIDPTTFGFTYLLYMIVWAVVGGVHTFAGPIIGLGVLTVVDEVLVHTIAAVEWIPLVYGAVLVVTLLFLPGGLESVPTRIRPLTKRMKMLSGRTG